MVDDCFVRRRNSTHRVRQMAIEAWKESETVFGRQGGLSAARLRPGHRAGFSAECPAPLVDRDVETAFGELVGGAEPADATAQHRNLLHGLKIRALATARQ